MSRVLVASDLDRTLIYSEAALALATGERPRLICVEHYLGREASFMTERAGELARHLSGVATVMPTTTRTPEQLHRVTLPGGPQRFAVAANGGILLVDGQVDAAWSTQVRRRLAEAAPLDEVWAYLGRVCDQAWTTKLRNAEDLFCYAVIDRIRMPTEFLTQTTEWAVRRGWGTSLQGRKLYWVPKTLTKAAAVREVARRIDAAIVLAAGDSLLDIDLLESADLGVHPRHGELFDTDWSAPHVTRTSETGVLAGEAILEWFAATAQKYDPTAPADSTSTISHDPERRLPC
ncbi:Hydroxymethylpyrimidine pyrophosphatase [Micromonospora pattaloongensis]|uniref:Hydroxymethylpyrimidine pyrophosphatase n=1 Tax=Micromonospora pattaloongensis TaxID=405436 RepID=A0A1H3JNG8_9ACTN|nr:HAD family hydrolase [Micromonospora pattaloongensis]SDY40814.1 Hydroxymethylpyrimidine pyrophosphatase [Micromonospora pattaloongensis]